MRRTHHKRPDAMRGTEVMREKLVRTMADNAVMQEHLLRAKGSELCPSGEYHNVRSKHVQWGLRANAEVHTCGPSAVKGHTLRWDLCQLAKLVVLVTPCRRCRHHICQHRMQCSNELVTLLSNAICTTHGAHPNVPFVLMNHKLLELLHSTDLRLQEHSNHVAADINRSIGAICQECLSSLGIDLPRLMAMQNRHSQVLAQLPDHKLEKPTPRVCRGEAMRTTEKCRRVSRWNGSNRLSSCGTHS